MPCCTDAPQRQRARREAENGEKRDVIDLIDGGVECE